MSIFFLLVFLFCLSLSGLVPSAAGGEYRRRGRRVLHEPFFPLGSFPPTPAPAYSPHAQPQQQQPKFPFSSSSSNRPFFPAYASPPPPPSPMALATFPANISALAFPRPSSRKRVSLKLVAIAVGVSLAAVAVIAVAALLLHHRRRHDGKEPRSDSLRLFPANAAVSDGAQHHKQPRNSNSGASSEFLYLGTLVNSRGNVDDDAAANSSNAGAKRSASASPSYQRLSSPELRPLPPLPRQNFRHSFRSADVGSSGDDEDEEFFSPRGSSSPVGAGSSSRRAFPAVEAENFRSRSVDSRTPSYPSSNTASPASSTSNSPPPTATVNFSAPPPLRPPPPPPPRRSRSHSPASETEELGRRISDVSGGSPQKSETVSVEIPIAKPPPPPPPPPPPRFWEIPFDPPPVHDPNFGPPPLVPPSRPVVFQNPLPESPLEQPQGSEAPEKKGENPKPKLKPLHWDKVRASSDRAMVWDQLKSSSFQ